MLGLSISWKTYKQREEFQVQEPSLPVSLPVDQPPSLPPTFCSTVPSNYQERNWMHSQTLILYSPRFFDRIIHQYLLHVIPLSKANFFRLCAAACSVWDQTRIYYLAILFQRFEITELLYLVVSVVLSQFASMRQRPTLMLTIVRQNYGR